MSVTVVRVELTSARPTDDGYVFGCPAEDVSATRAQDPHLGLAIGKGITTDDPGREKIDRLGTTQTSNLFYPKIVQDFAGIARPVDAFVKVANSPCHRCFEVTKLFMNRMRIQRSH